MTVVACCCRNCKEELREFEMEHSAIDRRLQEIMGSIRRNQQEERQCLTQLNKIREQVTKCTFVRVFRWQHISGCCIAESALQLLMMMLAVEMFCMKDIIKLFFYSANSHMADRSTVQDVINALININVNYII